MEKPHMVEQVIKYSDGTETVIKYRGVIKNGVVVPDVIENTMEDTELSEVDGTTMLEEVEVSASVPLEVDSEEEIEVAEEAPAESVEEPA